MNKFFLLLAAIFFTLCSSAQVINGDLDEDGTVTKHDVDLMIGKYLNNERGVTMHDVVQLIDRYINNAYAPVSSANMHNGHSYVDLGTGVKWATMNVGASAPESNGDYFAWGETIGLSDKKSFTLASYKWRKFDVSTYRDIMTKYCTEALDFYNRFYGDVDYKTVLESEDDVAHAKWGGEWRIPTHDEFSKLITECYWQYVNTYNDKHVNGYVVYKAKSDKDKGLYSNNGQPTASYSLLDPHIFLPVAGYYNGSAKEGIGIGYYWSSSLYPSYPFDAYSLYLYPDLEHMSHTSRSHGLSVRAVCK